MSLKLYYLEISPPARAALLAIRNVGVDVELVRMDLQAGDHLKPEFLKLNPRHQIPVLTDGDYVLCESRAIMTYLVNSRKPGCDLYPNDAKKRGLVDERLFFDATVVFPRNCDVIVSVQTCPTSLLCDKNKLFSGSGVSWRRHNSIAEAERFDFRIDDTAWRIRWEQLVVCRRQANDCRLDNLGRRNANPSMRLQHRTARQFNEVAWAMQIATWLRWESSWRWFIGSVLQEQSSEWILIQLNKPKHVLSI